MQQTLMYTEAFEASQGVFRQATSLCEPLRELQRVVSARGLDLIQICARGSSDHAGLFAKYVFERELKVPVVSVAPSVASVHKIDLKLPKTLFIAISQSGKSPDIILNAEAAKRSGAITACIVNDVKSPLAQACDIVAPIEAGPEISVAATKSFLCSLAAILRIASCLSNDSDLDHHIRDLPMLMDKAADLKWPELVDTLIEVKNLFVLGRSVGYAIACEAALKLKETSALHAEAYSLAEVKHGPMEIVQKSFPVLIFDPEPETETGIISVLDKFQEADANVFVVGRFSPHAEILETVSVTSPYISSILQVQTFYLAANAVALARKLDPDNPRHLQKVTQTV